MNIGTSNEYQDFIKNLFYYDRYQGIEIEPTASGIGNIYYRNTGKVLPVKYGDEYLYIDKLNISVNNNASPNPMMVGNSTLYSTNKTSNFEQDVFSIKYPIRNVSIGGAVTKNSQSWKNVIYAAISNTLDNNGNKNYGYFPLVAEPYVSPILKSASIEINKDCNWNLDWEIYDTDALNPVTSENGLLSNPPMGYDRTLKWYDVAVVIPIGSGNLYNKVKFIENSNFLYFYSNNLNISWNIDYETCFINNKNSNNLKRIPLINIKRITNKINLTGFSPSGTNYNFINNDLTSGSNPSDLFFEGNKSESSDDELKVYFSNNSGSFDRIDNLIPWNKAPFNLIDKMDISQTPNEPTKINLSITKIYS